MNCKKACLPGISGMSGSYRGSGTHAWIFRGSGTHAWIFRGSGTHAWIFRGSGTPAWFCRSLLSFVCVFALVLLTAAGASADEEAEDGSWPAPGEETVSDYYCVMDADTGTILAEKGMDTETPPASLTKIMTCLVALENGDPEAVATMTSTGVAYAVEGSSNLYTQVGEEFKLEDMLYGMMLKSANDIATQIGEFVGGGSLDTFLDMMNERAEELGCTGTHFANACGMPHDEHHSTAHDLALISREALKNDMFREIVHTKIHTIPATNMNEERSFQNHHKFLVTDEYAYDGIIGGKTGYTDLAGSCLATFVERNGRTVIVIALHSMGMDNCLNDTRMLCDFGLDEFENHRVSSPKGSTLVDGGMVTLPKGVSADECEVSVSTETAEDGAQTVTEVYSYGGRVTGTSVSEISAPPVSEPEPPVSEPAPASSKIAAVPEDEASYAAESGRAEAPGRKAGHGSEAENPGTAKAKDNTLVLTVAIMGGAMLVIIAILVGVNIHLANARKRLNRRLEDKK